MCGALADPGYKNNKKQVLQFLNSCTRTEDLGSSKKKGMKGGEKKKKEMRAPYYEW